MTAAAQRLASRQALAIGLAAVASLLIGAMLARSPALVLGGIAAAGIVLLAFAAPAAHLALTIVFTLIVPYSLQNKFGFGGSGAGLIASDLFVLTATARGIVVLAQLRMTRGYALICTLLLGFLVLSVVQFFHGIQAGFGLSEAGDELRELISYGVFLAALPIVLDEEMRPKLLKALLYVGFLLGLWGLAQWFLDLPYGAAGDFGVREGVRLTSGGQGQLQGGLYGFPVAVILGFAALMSGQLRATARNAVIAMTAMNGIDVLLTFERTFWVVTILGICIVVARSSATQRARALLLAPVAIVLIFVPVAFLSPQSLITARERLLSLGQYASDDSVRFRIRETQEVLDEIKVHPVAGSGLGAGMWWGRPSNRVPPQVDYFVHNGYLYFAWKIGIPLAACLIAFLAAAAFRPGRARGTPLFAAVATGGSASLIVLLVTSVTFPAIRSRPIIPTIALLMALSLVPHVRRGENEPPV